MRSSRSLSYNPPYHISFPTFENDAMFRALNRAIYTCYVHNDGNNIIHAFDWISPNDNESIHGGVPAMGIWKGKIHYIIENVSTFIQVHSHSLIYLKSFKILHFTANCLSVLQIWTRRNVYVMLLVDFIVSVAVHTQIFFIRFIYERGSNGWKVLGREVQIPVRFDLLLQVQAYFASVIPLKVVRAISSSATIIYGCISFALISRTIYVTLKVTEKSKGHHKTVDLRYFIMIITYFLR